MGSQPVGRGGMRAIAPSDGEEERKCKKIDKFQKFFV